MNNQNPYNRDPISMAMGAFTGLCASHSQSITIKRGGGTFAISASFPWLSIASAMAQVSRGYNLNHYKREVYDKAREIYDAQEGKIVFYLPSPSASGVSTLDVATALGGGFHEFGHALCDEAGGAFPTFAQFEAKVGKYILDDVDYQSASPHQITNLLADMRLEPGFVLVHPHTRGRFHAVQRWCHQLEEGVRGQDKASDFKMAMRDLGKGWRDEDAEKVYSEYSTEAIALVDQTRSIWEVVRPTNTNWKETAHLPVSQMVLLINEIHDLLKNPPPPKQSQDQGEGQDPGEGQEQGEGQSQGDSQDEGEGQSQGEGGIDPDLLKNLLDGRGEALDPSKGMSQDVREQEAKLGHTLYIPNGKEIQYRKLFK